MRQGTLHDGIPQNQNAKIQTLYLVADEHVIVLSGSLTTAAVVTVTVTADLPAAAASLYSELAEKLSASLLGTLLGGWVVGLQHLRIDVQLRQICTPCGDLGIIGLRLTACCRATTMPPSWRLSSSQRLTRPSCCSRSRLEQRLLWGRP